MVQMTNGANVASPVRIVTEQTSNQAHQQTQQQQQQQQQQQSQQQGMILTTAGNGTQTVQGQKVVQLIMAQPASGNNRVIGKNGRLPYIYLYRCPLKQLCSESLIVLYLTLPLSLSTTKTA